MAPPWKPNDPRWGYLFLGALILVFFALMFGGAVFGQGGDPRPAFQTLPIMGVSPTDEFVKVGDFTNHALRVNVVAGAAAGGTSSTFAAAFPTSGTAAGARDASGFMASLTVTNAGRLNVTCDNCSSSAATFGAAFPSSGGAIGFKDGGGMLASATVDNAGNQFVIASQGSSNWTVTATGTITAHQGDTWTVSCTNCTGASTNNFGSPFPSSGFANFRDGVGNMASASVDNASNLFVIASQGASNWTVIATGTVTAHQGDTWTVQQGGGPWTATGTVTSHQGDVWTVGTNTWLGSTAPTVGQKTMVNSLPVVIASDQTAVPVSGTVSSTQGTSPWVVSGTVTANAGSTFASTFPSVGYAVGFKDGGGRMASASVDNAGNLFTIASSTSSGATATIAPSRVEIQGGWGKSAVATAVTICDQYASVSLINGGNTQVITGVAGQQIHICSMVLITASATAVGIFEGGGTLCNTNRLGIIGSGATANGVNLATTGGFTLGTGIGSVAYTQGAGVNVCLGNSTTAVVSGGIKWTSY